MNRLSHVWARMMRDQVFPGGLLAQALLLQRVKTHLFPNTGLAAVIADFAGQETTFADLTLPLRRSHDRCRHRLATRCA